MADVVELKVTPNMTLTKGAAQHFTFADRAMPDSAVWQKLVLAHTTGRCLVIGAAGSNLLAALADVTTELTVLAWSVPDAARIGEQQPQARVLVGDVAAAVDLVDEFDTVICADLAAVLSLESPSRSWRELFDDVRALVADNGRLLLAVENDLGPHRLSSSHNPRSESSNEDWAPLATWDRSRPRTVAQVQDLGAAAVWSLAPDWPGTRLAWLAASGPAADVVPALALRTALWPLGGSDPSWLARSLAMAGRLDDAAASWLLVFGTAGDLPEVLTDEDTPLLAAQAQGDSLLGAFADACAAADLPAIRTLLSRWAEGVRAHPEAAVDLGAWLVADQDVVPIVGGRAAHTTAWSGLVSLVHAIRGRSWRHPWPAPTSDADLLAILGAMAALGEEPPAAALEELEAGPPARPDHFAHLDRQQLVAAIDRNNETIRTLRSRVSWTEKQLEQAKAQAAGLPAPVLRARRYAGRAKRFARRAAARLVR